MAFCERPFLYQPEFVVKSITVKPGKGVWFMGALQMAAYEISGAKVFIITAGAGIGVDSGLPDFRGNQGFWQAYPPYARLGISFAECANPEHFRRDPAFGWGFYGHRVNLYRETVPHEGFRILKGWIERKAAPYFVVTSNVDGQFQKAGFANDSILEVHGSIHWLQCAAPCSDSIWANREDISVDESTMRAANIPRCPSCGAVSRPNILMFGDFDWLSQRTRAQEDSFQKFADQYRNENMVVIEIGAGTAIPTIRGISERLGWSCEGARVIRINPREPEILSPHISIRCGCLDALVAIDRLMH